LVNNMTAVVSIGELVRGQPSEADHLRSAAGVATASLGGDTAALASAGRDALSAGADVLVDDDSLVLAASVSASGLVAGVARIAAAV
jgi:hypothetical protein